jgi:DNA-binding MarR family transcriptional regulator
MAEFRYLLRRFLHVSQLAAEQMGLRAQQYQMLQCVAGMPDGIEPTIVNVAKRMLLKHNSAVELVDRAIEKGLLRRAGDAADHRRILLRVTPQGERILASLAAIHTRELEQSGPELVRALDRILRATGRNVAQSRRAARPQKAGAR